MYIISISEAFCLSFNAMLWFYDIFVVTTVFPLVAHYCFLINLSHVIERLSVYFMVVNKRGTLFSHVLNVPHP